jgi:hypothetical protein
MMALTLAQLAASVVVVSSVLGTQFPQRGKSCGVFGISLKSPIFKTNPIPMSAWLDMWQWKNQKPENRNTIM